jgi:AcrR family transcriptional regulator
LGLRERKKQRTRQLISETAWRLFADRGFEQVTVAQVARAAEVSEATIFNYFKTKEALVFEGMENFGAALLAAVRDRPDGATVLDAVGRFMLRNVEAARTPDLAETITTTGRMVDASPTLRARQAEIFDNQAHDLAELLMEEAGADQPAAGLDDAAVLAAAHALTGVHRTVLHATRRAASAGLRGDALADEIVEQTRRALAVLADGLGDYRRRNA